MVFTQCKTFGAFILHVHRPVVIVFKVSHPRSDGVAPGQLWKTAAARTWALLLKYSLLVRASSKS